MSEGFLSLKKRLTISFLFVVVFIVLLFVSVFVKKGPVQRSANTPTPTLVPIDTNSNNRASSTKLQIDSAAAVEGNRLGEIFFDYQTKNIPTTGQIYTQAPTSIPADTIAKIQEKLITGGSERIINTPNGQVLFMQKGAKTLSIYLYSRTISYSDEEKTSPTAPTTDTASLIKKASDFITSLNLPFDKNEATVKYFSNKTGDLTQANSETEANLIDIAFKEVVSGLTVFRQYGSSASTHVWLTKDGLIKKFTYFYTPQYVPQKSILLPPLTQAEESIKSGKGIIVGLGADYQQPQLAAPTKTVFASVEVGYFNSGRDALLFPIFIFRGNALIKDTKTPITVYLPAID